MVRLIMFFVYLLMIFWTWRLICLVTGKCRTMNPSSIAILKLCSERGHETIGDVKMSFVSVDVVRISRF